MARVNIWSLILLILGFNIGLYGVGFGIGQGIFQTFAAAAVLLAIHPSKRTVFVWILAMVSAVSGLLVGWRANSFVQGISLAVSIGSLGLVLLAHSLPRLPATIWELLGATVRYFFHSLFGPFRLLQAMNGQSKNEARKRVWWDPFTLLKTATITVVVFGIFAGLLMAADPIFSKMVETIIKQAFGRMIWSLVVVAVFASLLTIVLSKQERRFPELRFLSGQDVVVPTVVLVGLFALFLFVQGKYLFASHEVFQQFGLTYSEYVRKGFMELLVATGIASVISYIVVLKQRTIGKSYLTWLNIGLLVELGLLLASAWRRDMMYIEVYGLTRMRIIGEVFLFWLLANLLLLFLLNSWKQFEERYLLLGMGVATLGVVGYLMLVNMDMRVVRGAPKRYEMNDLFYLANLSEDSAASWEGIVQEAETRITQLINKESGTLSDEERAQLANIKLALFSLVAQRERLDKKFGPWDEVKKNYLDEIKRREYERSVVYGGPLDERRRKELERWLEANRKWQAYTWSEMEAYKLVVQKREVLFDRVDVLLTTIVRYQKSRNLDLYKEENWILYDYKHPFVNLKLTYRPWMNEFVTPTAAPSIAP
ncbi:hypothetical protein A3A64_04350 [Candidatus Gottesmanbacteria bacterium RIFCSPLOWO2_01_FULL_48_11]|uniref:Uncharacterized protein n=2 Tax=Candidatus Gottesmaniibacteriota TaxID=1752720 RepID=A0A1F6AUE2_9BACT|nr:MAG: hypothetical protein A3A64_04350 [Candidatus Gottesmanbacteria bacterium RIFCSPLOWO2_01_FULL_48_11]